MLVFLWFFAAYAAAYILSSVFLSFGARKIIRKTFAERGETVTKVEKFRGFVDTDSLWETFCSAPYTVYTIQPNGKETEIHCRIRHVPFIPYVLGIEIWDDVVTA